MLVLGLAALANQSLAYTDGPPALGLPTLTGTPARPQPFPVAPLAGITVAAAGAVLLIVGASRRD